VCTLLAAATHVRVYVYIYVRMQVSAPSYVHSLILPEQAANVVQCQRAGGVVRDASEARGKSELRGCSRVGECLDRLGWLDWLARWRAQAALRK